MSRTTNAIKNLEFGILGKIVNLVLAFASRTIFIYFLGSAYLGVNGLYTEILSLLSFAELGFGSAMTFAMYRPVADDDHEKIVKLLDFYKKIYRIIAGIITVLGILLLPFLQYIVKGADWLSVTELRIYFLIFLLNTVVGYFVTYKYSYLNALQKNYINTNIDTIVSTVSYFAQMLIMLIFRNFLLYLLVNSFVLTISRIGIAIYLNKKYPILKEKPVIHLSAEEKRPIFKEVRGLMVHQFASVAVHSTDNILISMISGLGVVAVGYISNYNMLMNSVLAFVTILFGSVTSGFGNLVATSSIENYHKVFKEINFLNFWIYGFCSICFWILVPPFITLWIGADKLIDNTSFLLIIINCYLMGQSAAFNNARVAKGNFGKDKNWALAQAIINLVVSIVAGYYWGLVGIYIGTVVSRLVYVVFRPYSTYYFLFEQSSREYYKKFLHYFISVAIAGLVAKILTFKLLASPTMGRFIIATALVVLIINSFFLIIFLHSEELQAWKLRIKSIVSYGRK
ncbi:lipopolysaccharide biosynthesis protein [Faecalimonas umbilicata]|uniref:lipopolysaccharide biosynthesis protein n=1 Tax=Faecalimonas umbilicata TaxID=1912855 RepID=UPI0022E82EF4|nr:polysaccharide biosynthesis protein [Faecalimonas umbilicata]